MAGLATYVSGQGEHSVYTGPSSIILITSFNTFQGTVDETDVVDRCQPHRPSELVISTSVLQSLS